MGLFENGVPKILSQLQYQHILVVDNSWCFGFGKDLDQSQTSSSSRALCCSSLGPQNPRWRMVLYCTLLQRTPNGKSPPSTVPAGWALRSRCPTSQSCSSTGQRCTILHFQTKHQNHIVYGIMIYIYILYIYYIYIYYILYVYILYILYI